MPDEPIDRYRDMLGLPHHVSHRYAPMSRHNRAAQFMPFAALTGYEAVIEEAGRRNAEAIARADEPTDGIREGWLPS